MAGDNAEVRIIADLQRYVDEVKKLGPITDQEAIKAAFALESRVTKASEKAAKAAEAAAKQAAESSTKAAKKAGDAFNGVGDTAEKGFAKLGKAAALTGDAFGGLAGPIGDIGDAFGMMDPKVAAVVISVGALLAVFSKAFSVPGDVVRTLDDYTTSLNGTETAIFEARDALEAMDLVLADQSVMIAERVSPLITKLSNTYVSLSDNIGRALDFIEKKSQDSVDNLKEATKTGIDWVDEAISTWVDITRAGGLTQYAVFKLMDGQAARGAEVAKKRLEEAEQITAGMDQFQRSFEEFEREKEQAEKDREAAAKKRADDRKRAADKEAQERKEFLKDFEADWVKSLQAVADEQKRIEDEAFKAFSDAFDKRQGYLNKVAPELQDLAAELYDLPDIEFRISSKFDTELANAQLQEAIDLEEKRLAEIARLQDEAVHEAYVRDQEQRKAYEKSQVDGVASISGYVGQTLDVISGMFDENTKEGRKAIRELAVAQKAAAIFDVAIKGVQAVMAALTVPPPAGTALAVVAGAAAVASAAAVAAQPLPSFHTGRFAGAIQPVQPDEGPALLRRGEVVVPATTVAANGGVDQVRRRLGESGDGGGRVNVFLDLTDRTVRVPLARDIARSMNRTAYLGWAT